MGTTLSSWDISHSGSSASSLTAMNYTFFSGTFSAETSVSTLEFASTFPGVYGMVLDNVSAYAVPEPSSLVLGGAGMAVLLGLVWLRSRRFLAASR